MLVGVEQKGLYNFNFANMLMGAFEYTSIKSYLFIYGFQNKSKK